MDLECDETTFAPKTVLWSKNAYDYHLNAWEVAEGHCAEGGVFNPAPNTAPAVDGGSDVSGVEGSPIALDGSASDPDPGDSVTTAWSYMPLADVDPGASCSFADASQPSTTVTCTDDGTYTITLTASDGTATGSDSATVTVVNASPVIGELALSANTTTACTGGNVVSLSFAIADPGANDSQSGTIDWGDSSPAQPFAGASFAGTHTYRAGTYTATVNASDDDAGLAARTSAAGAIELLYRTVGFLEPLAGSGDRSVFKLGRTIPLEIEVYDCDNFSVSALAPHVDLTRVDPAPATVVADVVSSSTADVGASMRYHATSSPPKYMYNLSTKKSRFCTTSTALCGNGELTQGTYEVKASDSTFAPVTAVFDLRSP